MALLSKLGRHQALTQLKGDEAMALSQPLGDEALSQPLGDEALSQSRSDEAVSQPSGDEATTLSKLSSDELCIVFVQLCNAVDPGVAMAFSSTCGELWTLTLVLRQQLQAEHEAAAALGRKAQKRNCMELREAKKIEWCQKGLSSDDLSLLGTLGPVLPALEEMILREPAAGTDGVPRLAEKLRAGTLPAVTLLRLDGTLVGNAGASALAAALGRGALPRLKVLFLSNAVIGDAGLAALAPALRRRPALEVLNLARNPLGDEGIAALLAPPSGWLTSLEMLSLEHTQIADAGCAALAAAFDSGALPALENLRLYGIPASAAATDALKARVCTDGEETEPWVDSDDSD